MTMTIEPLTRVNDLLASYPEAFSVLLNHGMCADCQANPPAVPLAHFAKRHCGGDIDGLLEEIQVVVGGQD